MFDNESAEKMFGLPESCHERVNMLFGADVTTRKSSVEIKLFQEWTGSELVPDL